MKDIEVVNTLGEDNTMQRAIFQDSKKLHKAGEDVVFSVQLLPDTGIKLNQIQNEVFQCNYCQKNNKSSVKSRKSITSKCTASKRR